MGAVPFRGQPGPGRWPWTVALLTGLGTKRTSHTLQRGTHTVRPELTW